MLTFTHTNACMHACTHIHTPACVHMCVCACVRTNAHTFFYFCKHNEHLVAAWTYLHFTNHTPTRIHTKTQFLTCTPLIHTHTYTHKLFKFHTYLLWKRTAWIIHSQVVYGTQAAERGTCKWLKPDQQTNMMINLQLHSTALWSITWQLYCHNNQAVKCARSEQ